MTAFGKFAERMSNPAKVKLRVARTRKEKREEEKDDEKRLFKLWQKHHEERKKELLKGPHGDQVQSLIQFLEQMTIEDGDELTERSRVLCGFDRDTQHEVLSLINRRCILLRERAGLCPFDDSLDEPPTTVFLQIREMQCVEKSSLLVGEQPV